jgi:hypothetical protein
LQKKRHPDDAFSRDVRSDPDTPLPHWFWCIGAIAMLDFSTLDRAWSTVFDQFAQRVAATATGQGLETAKLLQAHANRRPHWQLHAHDVVLAGTLAAMDRDPLVEALERLSPFLAWNTRGVLTDSSATNRAYVELLGPDGMLQTDEIRLGVYWHDRHTFYPRHRHEAVELYHVVSGTALWQHVSEEWVPRPPDSFVLHQSNEDHATKTLDQPLLALWSWLGDISFDTYSMDQAPAELGTEFRDFARN